MPTVRVPEQSAVPLYNWRVKLVLEPSAAQLNNIETGGLDATDWHFGENANGISNGSPIDVLHEESEYNWTVAPVADANGNEHAKAAAAKRKSLTSMLNKREEICKEIRSVKQSAENDGVEMTEIEQSSIDRETTTPIYNRSLNQS